MFYKKQKIRLVLTFIVAVTILTVFTVGSIMALSDDTISSAFADSEQSTDAFNTEGIMLDNINSVKILIDTPVLFPDLVYSAIYDIDISVEYLNKINECIDRLETELATEDYSDYAHMSMLQEYARLQTMTIQIEADIELYKLWESEYYYAAKVWQYFKQRGYSDVVVSAILGNMMIETSGGTLSLKPNIYDPAHAYYGLCQWSLYYRPGIADLPFEYQLEYLEADMPREFNTFGGCYKYGFTYEDFLAMTDPAEAAYAFAKVYERCATFSYNLRKNAAWTAYNYFSLNNCK